MTEITRLIEPNSLVWLVGFEPVPGTPSLDFVKAWKAAAGTGAPGIVRRELYRQVPEWTALAAEEMELPVPFSFIEYSVLEPSTDPMALPSVPSSVCPPEGRVQAAYHVAFRFVADAVGEPKAVMFNLFEIDGPAAAQHGFTMNWPRRAAFRTRDRGFFSAMLHRPLSAGGRFAAFNRSEWQGAGEYQASIAGFEKAFPRAERGGQPGGAPGAPPVKVGSHLGLFETAASVSGSPTKRATMKTVEFRSFGGPEVLRFADAPQPEAGPGQVLLRVQAVQVSPLDAKMRAGEVSEIYPPWLPDVPGYSMSGTVEALGRGVSGLKVGDEVYGATWPYLRRGYAAFAAVPAHLFRRKPKNFSFAEAAVAAGGVVTAYGTMFGPAQLRSGQSVLIHGGAGETASYAVQLAKRAGARVVATASAGNLDHLRSLGADEAVDYRNQRFEDFASGVDVVLDTVGGETRARSWGLLKRGGTLVTLVPPSPDPALAALHGVRGVMAHGHSDPGMVLELVTPLFEDGSLQRPAIAGTMPLADAPAAHRRLLEGVKGRLVLLPWA